MIGIPLPQLQPVQRVNFGDGSMAYTVINEAPVDAAVGEESLLEIAKDLIMDLEETIEELQGWVKIKLIKALTARD